MKVLIADDEKMLTETLKELLSQNNIDSDAVHNGEDAVAYAITGDYDLILLDIMMPILNGIEAVKQIRKNGLSTPVLFLSAKSEVIDKIDGLENGGDDYLTKPFSSAELLARIKALTRRKSEYLGETIQVDELILNKNTYDLIYENSKMQLTKKEFCVMEMLITNPGIIIQKERILQKIWGYDNQSEYNTVEVYISFLRKKLMSIGANIKIKAIRGAGYILDSKD